MDYDQDGLQDLLSGDSAGNVTLFRNVGTKQAPRLAAPVPLRPGGEPFATGYRYKVCVADWNADGLPDLLIGNCETSKAEPGKKRRRTRGHVRVCLRQADAR